MQLCHVSSQWALNCEPLVQRISALEQHVEQLNGCMRSLEEENYQLLNDGSQPPLMKIPRTTPQYQPQLHTPTLWKTAVLHLSLCKEGCCTSVQVQVLALSIKMCLHTHTSVSVSSVEEQLNK